MFTAGAGAALAQSTIGLSYAQEAVPGQPMPPLLLESYADQTQLEAARILTRALVEVGFPVTLRPVDFGQLLGKVYGRRDYNFALMGLGAPEDRIDPGLLYPVDLCHWRELQHSRLQQPRVRRPGQRAGGGIRPGSPPRVDPGGAEGLCAGPAIVGGLRALHDQPGEQAPVRPHPSLQGYRAGGLPRGPPGSR